MNEDLINVSIIYFLEYNYFINRAMQIFKFLIFLYILSGCTTIEVAKEFTKATNSIKNSVTNITKNNNEINKVEDNNNILIKKEKESIEKEKEVEKNLATKQKKISVINFLGKTLNDVILVLGDPELIRLDGNTKIVRFDNLKCRMFFFFENSNELQRVKHFEIRNTNGSLVDKKIKIEECYKTFKLS